MHRAQLRWGMDRKNTEQEDTWRAALDGPAVEIKVRGSRFVAQSFAVRREEEARAALQQVRKKEHNATHHVSAWSLPPAQDPLERCDDDGEPSQTAGQPVLQAIRSSGLCGVLVVVTRWFGGTKLGTGGLIKAYGQAAALALEAAPSEIIWIESTLRVEAAWEDVGCVEAFLARHETRLRHVERHFGERATFSITCPRSQGPLLMKGLREASAARLVLSLSGANEDS